ncbi:MAG TPA: hypothetical protein VEU97_05835 [Ktedonobacteraceae bacterium]|nr:hypothetical protein [Ktedonobacteraceae bacterium]
MGTAQPTPLRLPFVGKVGLDKVMRRFHVQHTGFTLVHLFNAVP